MSKFDLPYYNSTSFPLSVKSNLEKLDFTDDIEKVLRYHQFVVREFFTRSDSRGILLAHGTGSGKTRQVISITTEMRKLDPTRKIIVLCAKSLEDNFRNEIAAYTGRNDDYINKNYKFVSLNSNNMFKKISVIDRSDDEMELETKLGNFMEDVIRDSSLENSLLIVEESHNLFNSITNGSKNALALYDLIMETKNIRLIFMSGTPIVNHPFELAACFNMLRGPLKITGGANSDPMTSDPMTSDPMTSDPMTSDLNDLQATAGDVIDINDEFDDTEHPVEIENAKSSITSSNPEARYTKNKSMRFNKSSKLKSTRKNPTNKMKKETYTTLFTEDIGEFENYFIDSDLKSIKNKDKFTNRIYGLCSYYGDLYFPSDKNKPGFPKELEIIVEKVHMSQQQFSRYMLARLSELEEGKKKSFRVKDSRFSSGGGGSSTYRVKSRQISNYCIPEYALGPVRGAKSREKFIDKITLEDLQNTDEFSPKMSKILHNIEKHDGTAGIVYSQFVSGEGIGIFSRVLQANGYKLHGSTVMSSADDYGLKDKEQKTFAVLTGDIDPSERTEIIKQFNVVGSGIKLLLLSGALAEGIDLKRVRHVHVMEPFWNYARINQVKARAIRFKSHDGLDESEQNVQTYIYLSDYPIGYPKNKIKELTTEVELFKKSVDNMEIINTFIQAIAESSVDCAIHYGKLDESIKHQVKCKMCSPDGASLFLPLLTKDMEIPSTCKPYSESKITVEEITLPNVDEVFYYKKVDGDYKIYHFNKKLNGYAPLLRSHPLFADIMSALINKE